jgi:hypothetical protein
MKYFSIFVFLIFLVQCSGQSISKKNDNYAKAKLKFETNLTNHFPVTIQTSHSIFICNEAPEINKLSFYLYEFGINENTLDSLINICNLKNLTNYNWEDSCLLIVHKNETIEPFDDETVEIINNDSSFCQNINLPIPNFIDLKSPNSEFGISIDKTFKIFVLETKAGNGSKNKMAPLLSMPKLWRNGFSRGYAISKEKSVLVYWMIQW